MNQRPISPAHILVVDDEPQIVDSVSAYLVHKAGYQVTCAESGPEAVDILRHSTRPDADPIDLVVMDMRMPGMTGLEVLQWLRGHETLAYTRFIVLTAASGDDEKVDALSAGADDYILKPYHPQELLARVNTILRTQQLEKQLQRQSQQLAALNRVSNSITTTLEIHRIPEAAVAGARAVLGVEAAVLFLYEQEAEALHCRAADGKGINREAFTPINFGEGVIGRVFAQKRVALINDPPAKTQFLPQQDGSALPVQNMLAIPLSIRGKPLGVLAAYNKPGMPFTDVDRDLLSSLGGAISRAIENAMLFHRVRARQQDLEQSRNQLQAVMDGILNPIYTINRAWELVAVNRQKAAELDHRPETVLGRPCFAALFGRESPCDHCRVAETFADRQARQWSVSPVGDDLLPQAWDIHAYPLPGTPAGQAQAVIVWQDRTEERRLENSLMQAGKLAAIGQLAAGVAHEINNPLTAINANAEMLKMFIPPEDENYESVDLIARAGERAANVVHNLLDFARQNQYAFEEGQVNHSLQQAITLVTYQLQTANITISYRPADGLPVIRASWEHLKTVWLNLLINARDALDGRPAGHPDPARIEVETRLDPEATTVQVLIRDNGMGMSDRQMAHIFEPFYTTKAPGRGTGLGLATSHRVIEQHGGQVDVVSRPGEGTTFIIHLPIAYREQQIGKP